MLSMLKKELKQFVRSRVNLLFVIAAPVILILIFSSLMSNYVGNNTNNEVLKGKLVYYINNTTGESANSIVQFRNFEETAEKDVGIEFKEISNIHLRLLRQEPPAFLHHFFPVRWQRILNIQGSICGLSLLINSDLWLK